jgi:hypothetical protein
MRPVLPSILGPFDLFSPIPKEVVVSATPSEKSSTGGRGPAPNSDEFGSPNVRERMPDERIAWS